MALFCSSGKYMWYSDASAVVENSKLWNFCMEALGPTERQNVLKFRQVNDRKLALLSIFLQKCLISTHIGPDVRFQIERTRENKPFAVVNDLEIGTWNYNASHHGKYVGIASDPDHLIGVDVVDLDTRSPVSRTSEAFIKNFSANLGPNEMRRIFVETDEVTRYSLFFVLWGLKEAYIKAVGIGLGFELRRVTFEVTFDHSDGGSGSGDGHGGGGDDVAVPSLHSGEEPTDANPCSPLSSSSSPPHWENGEAIATVDGDVRRDWR